MKSWETGPHRKSLLEPVLHSTRRAVAHWAPCVPAPVLQFGLLWKSPSHKMRAAFAHTIQHQHLPHPPGVFINDSIPFEKASVQYETINHAIDHVKKIGRGSYMAKTETAEAFRIIPVNNIS